MTRATQVTQTVSAMRKARAPRSTAKLAPMRFVLFEDNGGGHHWTIVADDGEALVQSASFASYEHARQAARIVRRGASQASLEDCPGDPPPGDAATARDRFDAERSSDEAGSASSEGSRNPVMNEPAQPAGMAEWRPRRGLAART